MTMECVCGMNVDKIAVRRDRTISKQLADWKKQEAKTVVLLLLGTGESGKSTITKQMKIVHINGYTESEKLDKVSDIRNNLKDSILTICGAMDRLGIALSDPKLQASVDYIMDSIDDSSFPQTYYDHVASLWRDSGVQRCYQRANEYQLLDCAKYFLDQIDTIRSSSFLPTEQDILRCRVMTNTIQRIDFSVGDRGADVPFSVYDVGGQRGERRKWIQVFDSASAILFVLDCSSFDTNLREEQDKNRLLEAVEIFEQVWNNRYLRDVSIILFINKIDLLEEKINAGKSFDMLLDNIPSESPYCKLFTKFRTYTKPSSSERKEFLDQFPHHPPGSEPLEPVLKRRKSRPTNVIQRDINEDVIKTAVFIKNVFMSLLQSPCKYRRNSTWHDYHSVHTCEYFYTCAVDTHTIRKVLEGTRTIIIKKHLDSMGINLF